jgi:hypothetical protein
MRTCARARAREEKLNFVYELVREVRVDHESGHDGPVAVDLLHDGLLVIGDGCQRKQQTRSEKTNEQQNDCKK